MARVDLILFQEDDGSVPMLDWLDELVPKARIKCIVRLERLEDLGHELRRPEAEYLGDNIYELRVKSSGINYRMLYFFQGTSSVVVSHGFSKQQAKVPNREIELVSCPRSSLHRWPWSVCDPRPGSRYDRRGWPMDVGCEHKIVLQEISGTRH